VEEEDQSSEKGQIKFEDFAKNIAKSSEDE
jgi:hypothetical protein